MERMSYNYLVNVTYEVVTEESAMFGDAAERGFYEEDATFQSLRDVADCYAALAFWCEWSSSVPGPWDWVCSEPELDFRTGEQTSYALHIRKADGAPLEGREIEYLTRKLSLA